MTTMKPVPQNAVTERVSTDEHARQFKVASRTVTGVSYLVSYFDDTTTRCSCPAGSQGRRCWHKSEVEKFIATQEAEADARLEAIVGEWWHSIYGDMTAQEVMDAEEEREEAAFWQDFNAARETIISAVNVWLSAYQPKEQPVECKKCGRRCNGQTGLCYRCEQEQRKAEAAKRETRGTRWTDTKEFSIWKSAS